MLEMENDGAGGRGVERAVGERNGGTAGRAAPVGVSDPELVEQPKRRRFTAEYKLRILREIEVCSAPGEVGELLRREGLYSSLLSEWRKQREAGSLKALDRKRGRKPADPRDAQIAGLRRRAERAEGELSKARRVIEVQGNVSALLGRISVGGFEGRAVGLLESDQAAGELEEREVVLLLLGPADEDAAVAVQPGVRGLDDPAPCTPAGCARLELDLLSPRTDMRRVAVFDSQIVHRWGVIPTIEAQPLWKLWRRLGTLDRDAGESRL